MGVSFIFIKEMNELIDLNKVLEDVKQGSLHSVRQLDTITETNKWVKSALELSDWNNDILNTAEIILTISNILYNNSIRNELLLDDGVYDLLLERFKQYRSRYPIGAIPVRFKEDEAIYKKNQPKDTVPFRYITEAGNMMFYDTFKDGYKNDFSLNKIPPFSYVIPENMNLRNVPHNNKELVGTLDKAKFVLNKDAVEKGVFDEPNVKVFERDFLGEHIRRGIIDYSSNITLIGELKYDGISVAAKIRNGYIIEANSRGDTDQDIATDYTPFLEGYEFPKAKDIDGEITIQFEAIIITPYLQVLQQKFGMNYVNCRNAIIGISGRKDAYKFRDYITLVPLKTDIVEDDGTHIDRLVEIEFLNKYFAREVNLKTCIMQGTYVSVLYQVHKLAQEAEYMRQFMPFMYDGIVVSYYGDEIRQILGRENFVDKYSIAIKFTPLRVVTQFLYYEYTVGQSGTITPMIYYKPVEFYGTIHDHSTGHSYKRFMELGLKPGDFIEVEYTNDVMPRVYKMDSLEVNESNPNPVVKFIERCPVCGCKIEISETGKSARCTNMNCPGRTVARMTNMMAKLNLKDFSTEHITDIQENLKIYSLADLLKLTVEDVRFLGPINSVKFIDRVQHLKEDPIYDYDIIGALGFTNIARTKWKLILNKVSLAEIANDFPDVLETKLRSIKGVGPVIVDTILNERCEFRNDLETIMYMKNIKISTGTSSGLKIRFTGIRDSELCKQLNSMGHDAGEGAVTQDTNILIVPREGHVSSKTKKAGPNTLIIPYNDFIRNLNDYIC